MKHLVPWGRWTLLKSMITHRVLRLKPETHECGSERVKQQKSSKYGGRGFASAVKHRLPKEVVETLSLEMFKKQGDVALKDMG